MTWDLEARNKCAKSFLSRMPAAFYTKYTDLRDVYYSTFESLKSKNCLPNSWLIKSCYDTFVDCRTFTIHVLLILDIFFGLENAN